MEPCIHHSKTAGIALYMYCPCSVHPGFWYVELKGLLAHQKFAKTSGECQLLCEGPWIMNRNIGLWLRLYQFLFFLLN